MGNFIGYLLLCNKPSQTYCPKTILSQDSVAWPRGSSVSPLGSLMQSHGMLGGKAGWGGGKMASSTCLGLALAVGWVPLFSSTWPLSPSRAERFPHSMAGLGQLSKRVSPNAQVLFKNIPCITFSEVLLAKASHTAKACKSVGLGDSASASSCPMVAKPLWPFLIHHCGPSSSRFQGKWHFRQENNLSRGPEVVITVTV